MDRSLVVDFNTSFAKEATAEERQLVSDLLGIWGRLDTSVAKNPALIQRGVLFGMNLQKSIINGEIVLRPMREKRKKNKTTEAGVV